MKKTLLLLSLLFMSFAYADIQIPNTKVSYKKKFNNHDGSNISMVFIDATEDPSGKSYGAFKCQDNYAMFSIYSKHRLGKYKGSEAKVYYRQDDSKMQLISSHARINTQSGGVKVLEFDEFELESIDLFLEAKNKVVFYIKPSGLPEVKMTLRLAGFTKAWQAVSECK